MYFKKLELFGFKSFADKTVLNFEPGITAVVGPNGCGKSNIFDSIRWVLGEQSSKELRGASMSDVVFNGTEKKPSLGFAEVSLTLDNKSRALEVDKDEVVITRRLYRSGESEYLLNKTSSRLKDIHEMLMGTGMGAAAYSMIQQGKVDKVVNAKPEERRFIIDEAAGITKYKAKKKEAINKLKDTENNLIRVNDIVTEVKRQIASIERQANKARKYKDEYEKLKGLEVEFARHEIGQFDSKKSKIQEKIDAIKGRENELNEEHDRLSENLTGQINFLNDLEQKINDVNGSVIKLEGQIDVDTNQIKFNQERIATADQNEIRSNEQKEQLTARCRGHQAKMEEMKQGVLEMECSLETRGGKCEAKRSELEDLERKIEQSKGAIMENEEKILGLSSRQVSFRNEVTDVMKESQGLLARKRRLELENTKVEDEKRDIDLKLQNVQYQMSCTEGTLSELTETRNGKIIFIQQLNKGMEVLEEKINELEKKKIFLDSQRDFIEKVNTQYDDLPDAVVDGKLITNRPPLNHHTGIIGKVKSVSDYQEKPRGMFRAFLAPIQKKKLYEIACETKFIELDPQLIVNEISDVEREVSRKESEKEELSHRIELEEEDLIHLRLEIQEKEKIFTVFKSQLEDVNIEAAKLRGEIDIVTSELNEVSQQLETIKKKEEQLNYELDTVTKDLAWCQNQIKDTQADINEHRRRKEQAGIELAQMKAELEAEKEKFQSLKDNQVVFAETLDGWLEEIKKIDDDLIQQNYKRDQYAEEIKGLELNIESTRESIIELKQTVESTEEQKIEQSQKINGLRSQMKGVEDELDGINEKVHKLRMDGQKIEYDEKSIKDRLIQSYRMDIDSLEQAQKTDDPTSSLESEEGAVSEDQTGLNPSEAIIEAEDHLQKEVFNVEEARHEIERLRKRCDSFGNVNLDAMDEYEELKERFEFLTSQQSDLLEAKSQLMSTINKINRSTRQMFMDTFTKVSEEFRIYFRMLFGGGEAKLILMDPENVLESGIDIEARPPGKKLQNITLLSGGEKTLTAIALVFGVFKVNPSPFCVLDEIDAALDESNVGRFSYLLKDFSKISQFIVITHNKKTISAADVLYGITMPETGISKIVSVKLEDKKKEEKVEAVAV